MSGEARTWRIGPDSIIGEGPRPIPECEVVELEPVLDTAYALYMRILQSDVYDASDPAIQAVEDFLRTHGRLSS